LQGDEPKGVRTKKKSMVANSSISDKLAGRGEETKRKKEQIEEAETTQLKGIGKAKTRG